MLIAGCYIGVQLSVSSFIRPLSVNNLCLSTPSLELSLFLCASNGFSMKPCIVIFQLLLYSSNMTMTYISWSINFVEIMPRCKESRT